MVYNACFLGWVWWPTPLKPGGRGRVQGQSGLQSEFREPGLCNTQTLSVSLKNKPEKACFSSRPKLGFQYSHEVVHNCLYLYCQGTWFVDFSLCENVFIAVCAHIYKHTQTKINLKKKKNTICCFS